VRALSAQGHPLATAVALKTLDIMERDGLMSVGKESHPVGRAFNERLRGAGAHPLVGEARGVGLVGAVELVARKATGAVPKAGAGKLGPLCAAQALERGLIVRAIGDSIALCPPLIISEAEVHELFDKLGDAMDATERKARASGLLDAD
jgi:4-aminobutyrate--pyruvate transaminase